MLSCQVFVVLNLIKYTDHVSLGQLGMSCLWNCVVWADSISSTYLTC